jgi:hypothetical protein
MKRKQAAQQPFIFLNEINALASPNRHAPRFEITCPKA